MTLDEQLTASQDKRRALWRDSRARVPFALIGVVLLLSAGLFVVHAQTGTDQNVDRDPDLAVERTETAAETAVRDGATRATERAAEQPLTSAAATRYGEQLDGVRPFRAYLKALVYLEVRKRLRGVSQQVGDVRTTARLPNVTDPDSFGEAIDRVSLRRGSVDPDLEAGTLRVTVEDVLIEARRNDEVIDSRRTDIEVTIATPLFELRDRTREFEQRLNAGLTEPGFGQRFNARIYALGWARGYAQYGGAPVTQVIANRHVVPAANDAIYRTQQDVFGAADPHLSNAVRRGWFCMAAKDANELYAGYSSGKGGSRIPRQLCESSEWIFGPQATGDPPESPGVSELLGSAPGMDAEHTISLGETAKLPLAVMLSGRTNNSLQAAVDRIYTIETRLDLAVSDAQEPEFDHDPGPRYSGSGSRVSLDSKSVEVRVRNVTELDERGEFYRIDASVALIVEERRRFTDHSGDETHETVTEDEDGITATVRLRLVESETSPKANIDSYQQIHGSRPGELAPEYEYERGPEHVDSGPDVSVPGTTSSEGFVNYARAADHVLASVVGAPRPNGGAGALFDGGAGQVTDNESSPVESERVAEWLESSWADATAPEELTLPETVTADVSGGYLRGTDLKQTIVADLARLEERVGDINVTVERSAVVQADDGDGPFERLYERVEAERARFLTREQPYQNVGQKAVYEARYAYFELILRELDRLDSAHGDAMDALDEEIGDLGLEDAMSFLQQGLTAAPPDPVPMESSSLTSNVTYEVSGSPTYLVADEVTSDEVPAVRSDGDRSREFEPLAAKNRNYLKLPYEAVVDGILNRVASALGFGDPDAELTFRMAGEALRASDLAIDAAEEGTYGEVAALESRHESIEDETAASIDSFEEEAAAQIAFRLYPDQVLFTAYHPDDGDAREHFGEYLDCEDGVCQLAPGGAQRCTTEYCALGEESTGRAVLGDIEPAVEEAVERHGTSTAERAIAISNGNVSWRVSRTVAKAIPEDQRPAYTAGLDDSEWRALVDSVTERAVASAASGQHVTLDDTDTVENLDTEIRTVLENVSEDIVEDRFAERLGRGTFNRSDYDSWVGGVDTPVRVPAGMPLLPLPNLWFATVNVWDVTVEGEYVRFEVTASQGTPETGSTITYVREQRPVRYEIAGEQRRLGTVEPISFDGRSVLIVVVPPGGIGVGDRDDEDPETTSTWPGAGYDDRPVEFEGG